MTLDELKLFLRIDGLEEDMLVQGLQLAAEEYLLNAGVNKSYDKELYKLAIKLLVNHWYENREIEAIGKNVSKIGFSLDCIITQLKYCGGDLL